MSGDISVRRDGDSEQFTSRLVAIVPVFNVCLDDIEYMYDNNGVIYHSIDELMDAPYQNYYILEYDMFWCIFEKWYKEHDFVVKFQADIYTGAPKKYNYIVPNILVTGDITSKVPRVLKARGRYQDKNFRFFDYSGFIRGVNNFNINLEKLQEGVEVIRVLETISQLSKHKGYYPSSIAGLARTLFGDPSKMNIDDERCRYCGNIRSAYRGGLYYLNKRLTRFPIVYDYDVRSMYPYILTSQIFPDPSKNPELKKGYVEVDNKTALAVYHIRIIKAQRKPEVPFNTIFTILEEQDRLIKCGCTVSFDGRINTSRPLEDLEGWLTSIDLLILNRDYDIEELEIDYTYYIKDTIPGFKQFACLRSFFKKKEESTGALRMGYKLLIDSYSGSLGSFKMPSFKLSALDIEDRKILLKPSMKTSPLDIAAFMTAYGRLYITKLAMLCEPSTIQSIDTDGIFTIAPAPRLDAVCGDNLGDIRLDKVMYDAVWFGNKQYESREDNINADFTPHIAGLPAYLYEPGKKQYDVPTYLYDVRHNKFVYDEHTFTLMLEDEEIINYEKSTNTQL